MRPLLPAFLATVLATVGPPMTGPSAAGRAVSQAATRTGCEGWRATAAVADERTNKRMSLKLDFDAASASWDIPPDPDPNAPPKSSGPDLHANLHADFAPIQPMADLQCGVFSARFKLAKTDVSPERTCRAVTNAHAFQGECVDAAGGKLMLRGSLSRGER